MIKLKRRFWWGCAIAIFVSTFIYGGVYFYDLFQSAKVTYEPIPNRPKSTKREQAVSLEEHDPVSFLLLGVDERPNDPGRSDTIMIATVNPDQKSVLLFNIPRDTYVDIIGKGTQDKINHAYAFGGVEMAIDTVERFLDIPIDYYAKINTEGFREAIDILGGVEIEVPFTFESSGVRFTKGPMFMDGNTAMKYIQMRKKDPRGDLGRNERQQQVVKAILRQSLTIKNFHKIDDVLTSVGYNLKTNIAPSDYMALHDIYRMLDMNRIESLEIEGEHTTMDGIYYYVVNDEERERISRRVKTHLGLEIRYSRD